MTVFLLCEAAACLFARWGMDFPAGIGLLVCAVYLYVSEVKKTGSRLSLRGLFYLGFVGGEGLACLKLSTIGETWCVTMWLTVTAAVLGFSVSYGLFRGESLREIFFPGSDADEVYGWSVHTSFRNREMQSDPRRFASAASPVLLAAGIVAAVSLLSFLIEAYILGYVPLFVRGVPHAYSSFHTKGLHYFTVSCVLVPALSVIYFRCGTGRTRRGDVLAGIFLLIGIAIPLLCVSRFQLVFAIALAAAVYFCMGGRVHPILLAAGVVLMIVLLVILTVARSHSPEYLNGVFEMKNSRLPLFFTQPYIYIAINYENLNHLIRTLPAHTFGKRMLMPLWTFLGLKFIFPQLADAPLYYIKEELTTTTLFYDAWYDFGTIGVLIFAALLGAAAAWIAEQCSRTDNPAMFLFYAQFAAYLALSFFSAWFSLPVTWFYFGVTFLAALLIRARSGRSIS